MAAAPQGLGAFWTRWRKALGSSRKARSANNAFLAGRRGVLHVGANTGQERQIYAHYALPVVWIEPIPSVFAELQNNIAGHKDQRAVQALVTNRDGDMTTLHVASNGGASSSILPLAEHKDVWPDVGYVDAIEMRSETLPSVLERAGIDARGFDVLVMDTQGSELLVLQGAVPLLNQLAYIKTEAADFEAYTGCAKVDEIETFLAGHGFSAVRKDPFAKRTQGGAYYDLLFKRR
jgi:FkbM family methyltransferase